MKKNDKNGVALIATLGLLAALLIMVIGYATVMRVERSAAKNFTDSANTRQLMLAALDTAVYELNRDWDINAYSPLNIYTSSMDRWDAYYADTRYTPPFTGLTDHGRTLTNLVYGTIGVGGTKHFLTLEDQQTLFGSGQIGDENLNVDWLPMYNEISGDLAGVYAYFISVDSERLDFNYVGNSTNAPGDRNAPEDLNLLTLDNIGDLTELEEELKDLRDKAVRYYNQAEFKHSQDLQPDDGAWANDNHFTTYSRFPQTYVVGATEKDRAVLLGGRTDLETNAAIAVAFSDAGLPSSVITALYDYVDADFDVGDGLSYTTEAVPMFNEIAVSNNLEVAGSNFVNDVRMSVEVSYPFLGVTNNGNYQVQVRAQYTGAQPASLNPSGFMDINAPVTVSLNDKRLEVLHSTALSASDVVDPASVDLANVEVTVLAARIVDTGTGSIVDELQRPPANAVVVDVGTEWGTGPYATDTKEPSVETDDPRMNRNGSFWSQGPSHTLGATNSATAYNPGDDGDLYIANRPILHVGELGFLGLADETKPWTSVDLLNLHKGVLDTFTVHTNRFASQTNRFVAGLVNMNSDDVQVLATALAEAPVGRYPGDSAATTLTFAEATNIAVAIANTAGDKPATGYVKRSQLADVAVMSDDSVVPRANENHREALIRQVADLMDVRCNQYTIVLAVRKVQDRTDEGNDAPNQVWDGHEVDFTLAEQFAVAHVWRDPDPMVKRSKISFLKWVARTE